MSYNYFTSYATQKLTCTYRLETSVFVEWNQPSCQESFQGCWLIFDAANLLNNFGKRFAQIYEAFSKLFRR